MKFDRHFASYQEDEDESTDDFDNEEQRPIALKIRKGGRAGKSKVRCPASNMPYSSVLPLLLSSSPCVHCTHPHPFGFACTCHSLLVHDSLQL